jgi:hypothetical protein
MQARTERLRQRYQFYNLKKILNNAVSIYLYSRVPNSAFSILTTLQAGRCGVWTRQEEYETDLFSRKSKNRVWWGHRVSDSMDTGILSRT